MPEPSADPAAVVEPRIAIVGGGVTGLAAAHRLAEVRPNAAVTLFEASGRVGGVLETVERDGFLIERSADNFLTKLPWAHDLCERIGIADQLLPTDETRRRALIVHRGRVKPTPEGFVVAAPRRLAPLLTTDMLSLRGKLRLACEPLTPPRRGEADESVAAFTRRRLGVEALERLVQPLVGGIYTADLEKLSMAATLPELREQERRHGSLWRAARRENRSRAGSAARESGARYGSFVAPRRGMSQLVDTLAARLPPGTLRTATPVTRLERLERGWRLIGADGNSLGAFDGVVVATPARAAAEAVAAVDAPLAEELSAIEYASSAVVCLGYRREQFPRLPIGFGFVVPAVERRRILAASFSSLKFPGRAPDDALLVRVFVGGALQPELVELADDALTTLAAEELAELLGARGEPRELGVVRWPAAMPQYHVGHLDRVARIEARAERCPGLAFAGAAYRGVGVPQCVHSGERAAERVAAAVG